MHVVLTAGSGRPGVGKTLTAEGIADHLKRPLYMVSAGELGIDASTLEKRLTTILDISFTWNAVLLIDEADGMFAAQVHFQLKPKAN